MIDPDVARAALELAIAEAAEGLAQGGVPVGAALIEPDGTVLGVGRNRRVQESDPSVHGETDAFRRAGRRPAGYSDTIMVTTLAPCLYCTGLIRQFGIGGVVVGDSTSFRGGLDQLADRDLLELHDPRPAELLAQFQARYPAVWAEDIGVPTAG